jgi:hypothetical protein
VAYLRKLAVECCLCCKPAKYELLNRMNAVNGRYCEACGKATLRSLKKLEDESSARAAKHD